MQWDCVTDSLKTAVATSLDSDKSRNTFSDPEDQRGDLHFGLWVRGAHTHPLCHTFFLRLPASSPVISILTDAHSPAHGLSSLNLSPGFSGISQLYPTYNPVRERAQRRLLAAYFWQKSCPQFLQWCRRSVSEKRTVQPEQLSPPSSFTQWSAAERPGWSLTDQLNTLPRLSPIRILLWSLQAKAKAFLQQLWHGNAQISMSDFTQQRM